MITNIPELLQTKNECMNSTSRLKYQGLIISKPTLNKNNYKSEIQYNYNKGIPNILQRCLKMIELYKIRHYTLQY